MTPLRPLYAWIMLLVLVLVWGSSFAVVKIALADFGPLWISGIRLLVGSAVLFGVLTATGQKLPATAAQWGIAAVIGALGSAAPFAGISWGLQYVPSGIGGLMMAMSPILLMLTSMIALPDERATPIRILGLVIGFVGTGMVIVGGGDVALATEGIGATIWPYAALLVGPAGYAIIAVIGRKYSHFPVFPRITAALMVASVLIVPSALLFEPLPHHASFTTIGAAYALGLFPTAIGTLGLFWLIGRTSARFVAQSNYLIPVTAVVIGAVVYAEQLGWLQYAGMVVILAGIAVSEQIWTYRTKASKSGSPAPEGYQRPIELQIPAE